MSVWRGPCGVFSVDRIRPSSNVGMSAACCSIFVQCSKQPNHWRSGAVLASREGGKRSGKSGDIKSGVKIALIFARSGLCGMSLIIVSSVVGWRRPKPVPRMVRMMLKRVWPAALAGDVSDLLRSAMSVVGIVLSPALRLVIERARSDHTP